MNKAHGLTSGRRESKRREALKLLQLFDALIILSLNFDSKVKSDSDRLRAKLDRFTNQQLSQLITNLKERIRDMTSKLKPSESLDTYREFVAAALRGGVGEGQVLYLSKWILLRRLPGLKDYRPDLDKYPEHAGISIDVLGSLAPGTPVEVRILEAALFEDLCSYFNRAMTLLGQPPDEGTKKAHAKETAAMRRGAVLCSFYFVEAYLNSIAFDHAITKGESLSRGDLDRLTEWDSKNNRQRMVGLRDKLLHYPRIILGAESPPIHENNNADFKYLLDEAKSFRDAIVHANPRPDYTTFAPEKEWRFWSIGSDTMVYYDGVDMADNKAWTRTVTTSIAVVREIERAIHGSTDRLFWLHEPEANGLFPAKVFD